MAKTATQSTELAERISVEQVEHVLLHGGELAVASTDAVQDDMVRRILSAESLQDAFANFKSVPAAELDGQAVEVHGVAWMRSAFNEGPQVYALLKCRVKATGEDVVVSMGGRTLMASFLYAQRQEAMPFAGAFRKLRSNANSERSYWTFVLA